MRRVVIAGIVMLMGAVAVTGVVITVSAAQPAGPVHAPTPEAVLQQVIEDAGEVYAGVCAETRSPEDIGKVCATLIAERDGDGPRAYLTGRTFSEYSQWVFIAPDGEGWRLVGTAPLDFHAETEEIPWPE